MKSTSPLDFAYLPSAACETTTLQMFGIPTIGASGLLFTVFPGSATPVKTIVVAEIVLRAQFAGRADPPRDTKTVLDSEIDAVN